MIFFVKCQLWIYIKINSIDSRKIDSKDLTWKEQRNQREFLLIILYNWPRICKLSCLILLVIAIVPFCLDFILLCFQEVTSLSYLFSSASRSESRSYVSRSVHFVHANRELNSLELNWREDFNGSCTVTNGSRSSADDSRAWFFSRISWIAWKRSTIFHRLHCQVCEISHIVACSIP